MRLEKLSYTKSPGFIQEITGFIQEKCKFYQKNNFKIINLTTANNGS